MIPFLLWVTSKNTGKSKGRPNPCLEEFRWGETTPAVEIRLKNTMGYQAFPVSLKKIFTGK